MDKIKYPKIYFLIADHVNKYEDSIIYIAEGLQKLNIPFYSNKNFWLQDVGGEYLFKYDKNIHYSDCDIVIISYTWFEYMDEVTYQIKTQAPPKDFFEPNRKYKTVYLDPTDGYRTKSWEPYFRQFDLILRAKFNKRTYNPSNVKSWFWVFLNLVFSVIKNVFTKKASFISIYSNIFTLVYFVIYCRKYLKTIQILTKANWIV